MADDRRQAWDIIFDLTDNAQKLDARRTYQHNIANRMCRQMKHFQDIVLSSVYRDHPNAGKLLQQGRDLWDTVIELGECMSKLSADETEQAAFMIELINALEPDLENDNGR